MKHLLPFIFCLFIAGFAAQAQSSDTAFKKQWYIIDSLITKSKLPKSALVKVNIIYEDAKRRGLPAQVIKALLYKIDLQDKTADDDINKVVAYWNKEIASSKNIVQQSILNILLAETLHSYFNNHSWQINGRSKTVNFKKEDITSWGIDDFYNTIDALFAKALQPATVLQQTMLREYDAIIIKGNTPQLRPTLYDLLANIALDYYKTRNYYQTLPENAFALNDTVALADANHFVKYKFTSTDTSSRLLKALHLYQDIISFHAAHGDTAALIDINIDRITWVHDNAAFANKDAYYKTALEDITQHYVNHPQAAQAWYLLISKIAEKARDYKPFTDTANRYGLVTAKSMIEERLKAQPTESEGNSNMQQLLHQIEAKELHTEVESVNLPGVPFRVLVQYKNTDTLYGRIINKKLVDALREKNDELFWKKISSLPYTGTFAQALPQTNDYQQHKTEIKMEALPPGEYVLLGSSTKGFVDSTGRLLTQEFTVSHLSYINKGSDYFVLDRESGKPLKGVKVTAIVNYFDSKKRKGIDSTITLLSNQQGYIIFPVVSSVTNYRRIVKLTEGDDILAGDNNSDYSISLNNNETSELEIPNYEKDHAIVNIYTDRSIYRPGQKVFFKGIAVTADAITHKPKLYATEDSLRVYLKDVNNQSIDSVSVKLNDYGSIAGSFLLPAHSLTGQFGLIIQGIDGAQYFRVEEYKRPTFYVQLDTLKSAYRLRDTITVTGFAQALAGNFLNNAQVKYNILRGTRYRIYDWGFKRYPTNSRKAQIAEGIVTTDGSGRFTIKFPAMLDETADTSTNPIFDFTVNATVTDAGGETREANTSLSVGYRSLTVKLDVPAVVEKNDLTKIAVSVENLSGKPVDANVHINVYPLQPPGRTVRKRYWDRPDMFVMSKEEFVKNFPYDEYENESDEHTWQKGAAVVDDTFGTAAHTAYSLQRAQERTYFTEGWYVIEAVTMDKNGCEAKDVAYIEIYDSESHTIPAKDDNFIATGKTLLHPGENAKLLIASGFEDVFVLQQIDKPSQRRAGTNALSAPTFYLMSGRKKTIEEPVTEEDRGGFGISYAFVKHNRFYINDITFYVPFDDKELNVKYTTYRNKTEPGSKEQWTVQVTGSDSTKKAAELLMAMYDASLDQFNPHGWNAPGIWPVYNSSYRWNGNIGFGNSGSEENNNGNNWEMFFYKTYDELVTQGNYFWEIVPMQEGSGFVRIGTINQAGAKMDVLAAPVEARGTGMVELRNKIVQYSPPKIVKEEVYTSEFKSGDFIDKDGNHIIDGRIIHDIVSAAPPQLRTNFNETAFFFPQLYPDSAGNYTIQFTMPESLTKWKWMSLAHTKDLSFGGNEQAIITQKTLMVQPGVPRFLREGDHLELTARISNMGDTALTGQVELQLLDAQTNNPVDGLFQNVFPNQYFTSEAGQTSVVKFPVVIPFNYNKPLTYRIVAKTGSFNDGEENTLPVLTNRMLVTESLPLYIKGDTTQHFTFDKLLNNNSETLQTQSLTVEYTANPIWNAVQALPYLMEYPYECSEQTFNRFYANALAAYIVKQHPRIKQVFEKWAADSAVLTSNLEKNQELKQILLAETPWVLDAQNETQQRKNIALLFDMVKMGNDAKSALQKLQDMQADDGGFAWFKGGYADRYITQYILTGIGRLQELQAVPAENAAALNTIVLRALVYLDKEANDDYNNLIKSKADLTKENLSQAQIQYLYMRSYFTTIAISNKKAYNYFYQQAMKYWQSQSVYMQGMIGMTLLRTNQQAFVLGTIYPSIIENAVATKEKGMYWKDNQWGYYWYQSPIEQQALLIELAETVKKQTDADEMKTWLINQKQTTNWKTTKATADACFALLLNSDVQLDADRKVTINLGGYTINNTDEETVAGTGYFKKVLDESKVKPAMGNITVSVQTPGAVKNTSPSYGAVYWQYFEDMDKITTATTSLSLNKKIFIEHNTSAGKVLTPVNDDSVLHVGDKVIVRVELKTDRNLEYIHLKDMRAASMEPVNVLSEYKWQDGLGYYESTKDVATDFFISYMPKGSYVFEYPVYITHIGTFSGGIATVQCMYAPEFSSHSEGLKINVEEGQR